MILPICMFPKIGVPPNHPFSGVFHYKPSILGYPYFWKHPFGIKWFVVAAFCVRVNNFLAISVCNSTEIK